MDRNSATALMQELMKLAGPLNNASSIAMKIEDQSTRESLLRSLGQVMDVVYVELLRPIVREFPQLDPDAGNTTGG